MHCRYLTSNVLP